METLTYSSPAQTISYLQTQALGVAVELFTDIRRLDCSSLPLYFAGESTTGFGPFRAAKERKSKRVYSKGVKSAATYP